ncbi:VOC family protein [Paraburkholderia sp. RCC_158]|uniref:VOC family protein n=1 Tax=Paraburkholderia sp. RCC_158 TaxID=3239220 RepID=UPI003525CD88
MSRRLDRLPLRLHHHAFTTDDHEANRQFYEDILGLPLVAMWIEDEVIDGEHVELGHAFYGLADGSALAFFHFADPQKQALWKAREQSLFIHLSLLVEPGTQQQIQKRIADAALHSFTMDHGFCKSLYVKDPNGLMLEFTVDHPDAQTIAETMAASAHEDLRRWLRGERKPNNEWRPPM